MEHGLSDLLCSITLQSLLIGQVQQACKLCQHRSVVIAVTRGQYRSWCHRGERCDLHTAVLRRCPISVKGVMNNAVFRHLPQAFVPRPQRRIRLTDQLYVSLMEICLFRCHQKRGANRICRLRAVNKRNRAGNRSVFILGIHNVPNDLG